MLSTYTKNDSPKIEYEALKNNVLSSLCPMDENPRRHEQVSSSQNLKSLILKIQKFGATVYFPEALEDTFI